MTSDAALPLTTTAMDTPERRMLSWLALAAGLALTVTTGATVLGAPGTDPHVTPWGVTSEAGSVDTRSTDGSGTVAVWSAPAAPTTGGASSAG